MFLSSFFLLQSHGGPCGEGARCCSSSQCVTASTSTYHSPEGTGPGKSSENISPDLIKQGRAILCAQGSPLRAGGG